LSLRFDLYVEQRSWLHQLDPRTKMAMVLASVVSLLMWRNVWLVAGFLAGTHLLLWSGRIPRVRLVWIWRVLLPFSFMIFLLWPIFYPGPDQALLEWWVIRVTPLNLLEGLAMALRIDALAFSFFVLLLTTEQSSLVRGLVKLGMPSPWGLSLAVALRYLPTFYGSFTAISEAQQARGLDLKKGGAVARLRSYMPILVAMIISALRLTDSLAMALEARGFGAQARRTCLWDPKLRASDRMLILVSLLLLLGILAARVTLGLGVHPMWLIAAPQ
jgi:energy-coupling factor transport system permease protein